MSSDREIIQLVDLEVQTEILELVDGALATLPTFNLLILDLLLGLLAAVFPPSFFLLPPRPQSRSRGAALSPFSLCDNRMIRLVQIANKTR